MIRASRQGLEEQSFTLEAIEGPLLQRSVAAHIGFRLKPMKGLRVEIVVRREGAPVEEALPEVADRPLHLALGLSPIGSARSDPEVPVVGVAHELRVLDEGTIVVSTSSMTTAFIWSNRSSRGTPPEVGKRRLQAMHQGLHGLPGVELNPQQPRVAQHDD